MTAAAITIRRARDRDPERLPALLVSGLLHAGLLAAAFQTLNRAPKPLPIPLGEATPVSIVTTGPPTPATVKGPTEAPATSQDQTPSPEPPPRPAPRPRPTPTPAPPPPPPHPAPAPVPAPPRPAPVLKPPPRPVAHRTPDLNLDSIASTPPRTHARPRDDLDLSSIASSVPSRHGAASSSALDLSTIGSSLPHGSGPARGPDHAATSSTAHPSSGPNAGLSAGEIAQLRAKLNRLWNTDCSVPGADAVVVRVRMRLAPDGSLSGAPSVDGASGGGASEAMVSAATARALSAVRRGAPYHEISPEHLKTLTQYFDVKFDGKAACG